LTETNTTLTNKLETELQRSQNYENMVMPLEKKLNEREQTLHQLNSQYTLDSEEKFAYIKKLEADCKAYKDEREFLTGKVQMSEKMLTEKIEQLRKEGQELSENYQNQCRTIEKIMLQKRNLMFQLTNEVKRNGMLVKENSELRQTIQLQQHYINNMGIQSPPIIISGTPLHEKHQNGANNSEIPLHPEQPMVQIINPVISSPALPLPVVEVGPQSKPVFHTPDYDEDTITINSNSWISTVPFLGKFLSPPKTFRKKFEVIV